MTRTGSPNQNEPDLPARIVGAEAIGERDAVGDLAAAGGQRRLSPWARQFAGALSWNLAGHALVRVTLLLAGVGVARYLGVDAFADFTFYLFSINLLAAFSDMGISYAMVKYGVIARLEGEQSGSVDRLAATLQLAFAGFLLSFAGLVAFTQVANWPHWQIGAFAFAGLAAVWQIAFAAVLLSMRKVREIFIGNAIFAALLLTGVAVAASTSSSVPVLIAYPIGATVQCIFQAHVVNRALAVRWRSWLRPRPSEMRAILGLLGFLGPTSALASALPWAVANIQLMQGVEKSAVAVFGTAITLFGLTMLVPGRIAQLLFIDQVEQRINGRGRRRFITADLGSIAASVAMAAVVVSALYIFGDFLLDLYGPAIKQHSGPIYAFAAVAILACAHQIVGSRMVAVGWQALWLPITAVQAAVLLALVWNAPAAPEWVPAIAYWASYGASLVVALPLYLYAVGRPRV